MSKGTQTKYWLNTDGIVVKYLSESEYKALVDNGSYIIKLIKWHRNKDNSQKIDEIVVLISSKGSDMELDELIKDKFPDYEKKGNTSYSLEVKKDIVLNDSIIWD